MKIVGLQIGVTNLRTECLRVSGSANDESSASLAEVVALVGMSNLVRHAFLDMSRNQLAMPRVKHAITILKRDNGANVISSVRSLSGS